MDFSPLADTALSWVKWLSTPIDVCHTACSVGSKVPFLTEFAEKNDQKFSFLSGFPETAALAIDGLVLARIFVTEQKVPQNAGEEEWLPAKVALLALSIIKKSCTIFKGLQSYRFIEKDLAQLGYAKGIETVAELVDSTLKMGRNLNAGIQTPELIKTIPKFLKASLLCVVYLTDNKEDSWAIKLPTMGLGFIATGYDLYQFYQTTNFREWEVTRSKICIVITLIFGSAVAIYSMDYLFPDHFFIKA